MIYKAFSSSLCYCLQDYKEFLETLMIDGGPVKDVRAHHTDNTVSFTVTVTPEARIMEV